MASFIRCIRPRTLARPLPQIVITEPGGTSRLFGPPSRVGGITNLAPLNDDQDADKRRKSSFALDNKIWDLEDQTDSRERIFQTDFKF